MTFTDFIIEHENDDIAKLLLGKAKWPDIDMERAATVIECRRRIRAKLPEWYSHPEIIYPDRLSTEQCSSSETAGYKASVAARIAGNGASGRCRIADLTGGLGVDSGAFAKSFGNVLYNEMEPRRADAARHNFNVLGRDNIEVTSFTASREESRLWDRLRDFSPDIVFVDPARRSAEGDKVFLLEECSPDVLGILPDIFSCTDNLLLKLSPMADITMAASRLEKHGAEVREIHCIASGGECKELLIAASKAGEKKAGYSITVYDGGKTMSFSPEDLGRIASEGPELMAGEEELEGMKYLFEPGKALAKAGLFNAICSFGLRKAGVSTHLYFSREMPDSRLLLFGKTFSIKGMTTFNKQGIRTMSKMWPECEVTARNIPVSSDGLRKKLGSKSGGKVHIFGMRMDFSGKGNPGTAGNRGDNYLIAGERL
ncbi:MAG: hypothetical protein ACI3ZC_02915 [Candidatus Cryptobacteroides sp.]